MAFDLPRNVLMKNTNCVFKNTITGLRKQMTRQINKIILTYHLVLVCCRYHKLHTLATRGHNTATGGGEP